LESWLAVFGRFHVLVLHVPIGLLVALAALELLARHHDVTRARRALAALTALAALVTAATGFAHGHTEGRELTETLQRHQTLGLLVAGACLLAALLARRAGPRATAYRVVLVAAFLLVVPAGDLGATMTHGAGFLLEPLHAPPAASVGAVSASSEAYEQVIAPLLQARCGACHNPERRKGKLVLVTSEGLRAGGRNGPVFVAGRSDQSEMLRRLRLPPDDEDHMPPVEKPQPTAAEIETLAAWIGAGAPFTGPVEGLDAKAAPGTSAPAARPTGALAPPADPAALAALRAALVHVEPAEPGDNLLWIDAAGAAETLDDARARELLEPLSAQVAELSLARAPVSDDLMPLLARCPRLRRLDLRETALTSAGLRAFAGHAALEELVLVHTHLDDGATDTLADLPALRRVHLWGAGLSDGALLRLAAARPALLVEAGEKLEDGPLETEPPVVVGDAQAIPPPANTTCPVSGKLVDPAFSIVDEGRVVGFCCPKCPEQFWADPAAFRAALK